MSEPRDFNDPRYKKWRRAVFRRDKYACRMPGCPGGEKRLNAHHIRRWANWPTLRFAVGNGIALCRGCHEKIRGLEEEYEALFLRVVNRSRSDLMIQLMLMRYAPKDKEES